MMRTANAITFHWQSKCDGWLGLEFSFRDVVEGYE